MAVTKDNGSRRGAQVQAETPVSEKKKTTENNSKFQFGKKGALAVLWEFTAIGPIDQKPPAKRVMAQTLDEAVEYMRQYHEDFLIEKAEHQGLIWILSSWPLN